MFSAPLGQAEGSGAYGADSKGIKNPLKTRLDFLYGSVKKREREKKKKKKKIERSGDNEGKGWPSFILKRIGLQMLIIRLKSMGDKQTTTKIDVRTVVEDSPCSVVFRELKT